MMKGIGNNGRDGTALVTAVIFVFFLTLFGLAFYQLAETEIPLVSRNEELAQALYAAESGLERASWLIKKKDDVTSSDVNPFSSTYDWAQARSVANAPDPGDFYPDGAGGPYFKVVGLEGVGTKVLIRVLGAIDVDADGDSGLTDGPDDNGFRTDPEDVNRRIRAHIGLPGSLGNDISAGAVQGFEGSSGPLSFYSGTFPFFGDPINVWRDSATNPGLIMSRPIETGEDVVVPKGLFDESGNLNTEYFADCDKDELSGPRSFDGTSYAGKKIVLVTGDAALSGNWQGRDVAVISTTKVTLSSTVDCGRDGRLILIAPAIELDGDNGTRINGIAVSEDDIRLIGDGTRPIQSTDDAAIFVGTLLAGGRIILQQAGWLVVFEEGVINGTMLPQPALTYDDMEDDDTLNMYLPSSSSTEVIREEYSADEISGEKGDSQDLGIFPNPDDGKPDFTKVEYPWCKRAVRADLINGIFHDPDIPSVRDAEGYHDWSKYDRIAFWMKLGNWFHSHTRKTATILMTLTDATDLKARKVIDYEHAVQDPTDTLFPWEKAEWKRVIVRFTECTSDPGFDRSRIKEISFSYYDLEMDLKIYGRVEWIEAEQKLKYYDPGVDGWYEIHLDSANDRLFYWKGSEYYITWYDEKDDLVQGGVGPPYGMRPYAIAARTAVDRLELPGATPQDYGLPSCFQYDVTAWEELR